MSLHYFVPREPKPQPIAELFRQVAFSAEQRVPLNLDRLLRRLGPP